MASSARSAWLPELGLGTPRHERNFFTDPETLFRAIDEPDYVVFSGLLSARDCADLDKLYAGEGGSGSRVDLARRYSAGNTGCVFRKG